jgi:hypothetical protein
VFAATAALRAAITPAGRGSTTRSRSLERPTPKHVALSWARLKRVFGIEIEQCARCGGRLEVIASTEEPRSSRRDSPSEVVASRTRATPAARHRARPRVLIPSVALELSDVPTTPRPQPIALRIELLDVAPLVWRRVPVSNQWTLASLHGYLQWVMGWTDLHAHEFQIGAGIVAPDWWIREADFDTDTRDYRDERRVSVAASFRSWAPPASLNIATTWVTDGSIGS